MWNTMYVTSTNNSNFRKKVNKALRKSYLTEGQDFIIGDKNKNYSLYWVGPHINLKQFKRAIGAEMIWKFRLIFNFEIPKEEENIEFSTEEINLINQFSL